MDKVLERVIYNRLLPIVMSQGGWKVSSIIDVIKMVTGLAGYLIHRRGSTSKYCAVVTLNVKNAFNSDNRNLIRKCLTTISVLTYLAVILDIYLRARMLWYDTDDGPEEYFIRAGVPEGSVLSPLLRNTM